MRILYLALLFGLLIGLQIDIFMSKNNVFQLFQLKHTITQQKKANVELQDKNSKLMDEIYNLQNDIDATESIAREQLGMIKSGEQFFMITRSK